MIYFCILSCILTDSLKVEVPYSTDLKKVGKIDSVVKKSL
jgi:hypothetical protein